jgi:predicted RNase H-like nuclease (RuvC/YqgF family)
MDVPDDSAARSQLERVREALQAEVTELSTQRQELEAQVKALGGELEEVNRTMEAKHRMLRLVEATEQQLAHQQEGLHGDDAGHDQLATTEVRGGAYRQRISRFGLTQVCPCSGSLRHRLRSSGPAHPRLLLSRSLSTRGPSR